MVVPALEFESAFQSPVRKEGPEVYSLVLKCETSVSFLSLRRTWAGFTVRHIEILSPGIHAHFSQLTFIAKSRRVDLGMVTSYKSVAETVRNI